MFGLSGKMKRLSDSDIRMNEQAASVAASVIGQPVEAATRCEQLSTKATQMYPSSGGEVWSKQVPNGTGLPKTFLLAVARTHVYAIQFKEHRGELAPGGVIKAWDRAGFRAHTGNNAMTALGHVPDDRQALMLFLPIDGDASQIEQAIAQQRVAAGGRTPSRPFTFFIGTDAASARVVAALGAQPLNSPGAGPKITIGQNANIRINPGANITVGGQRLQDLIAHQTPSAPAPMTPPPSTAQRLQELETLRATGAISDDEYGRKRQQIIAEI
ncbi:SHOCT domain-containing protein [Mycolicibacterium sp.]|uniref:SHOCT domain-containing protein n=1 Tax=Mycolicibacterium sp. TaxID=2320850 RepID=UPI0037C91CBC